MKLLLSLSLAALLVTPVSAALTAYSTSFTSADGFTEGGNVNGVDGWVSNTVGLTEDPLQTFDVAGDGEIRLRNGTENFLKMSQSLGGPMDVNETISLTTTAAVLNTGNNIGFNAFGWFIGLGNNGTTQTAGVQFGGAGTDFIVKGIGNATVHNLGSRDLADHVLRADITKTDTANTFSVSILWDSTALQTFSVVNSNLYNASEVFLVAQPGGGGVNSLGGVDVDTLSAEAVPEPSRVGLLGLALIGLVVRRRR